MLFGRAIIGTIVFWDVEPELRYSRLAKLPHATTFMSTGAKWARTVLAEVLCDCVEEGDLSVDEAIAAAESILSKNSLAFYKLTTRAQTSDNSENQKAVDTNASKNFECSHSSLSVLDKVDYVRLLWGDTTGQRRCRVRFWLNWTSQSYVLFAVFC